MDMTFDEKLVHYATAPRVSAGKITDMYFVTMWAGKVRGKFVSMDGQFKFTNKDCALALARAYRQSCIDEAKSKGLI
tara:strand:- start:99 stop:329 length:231 start_codon:yes stop_codon:yes gene_type:complete